VIIVLAGELHRQLDRVDLRLEPRDQRVDVRGDVLPFLLELEQDLDLFRRGVDRLAGLNSFFDSGALAPYFLRLLLVVPESGSRHLALDLIERFAGGSDVKDSSGRRECGRGARRVWTGFLLSYRLGARGAGREARGAVSTKAERLSRTEAIGGARRWARGAGCSFHESRTLVEDKLAARVSAVPK